MAGRKKTFHSRQGGYDFSAIRQRGSPPPRHRSSPIHSHSTSPPRHYTHLYRSIPLTPAPSASHHHPYPLSNATRLQHLPHKRKSLRVVANDNTSSPCSYASGLVLSLSSPGAKTPQTWQPNKSSSRSPSDGPDRRITPKPLNIGPGGRSFHYAAQPASETTDDNKTLYVRPCPDRRRVRAEGPYGLRGGVWGFVLGGGRC